MRQLVVVLTEHFSSVAGQLYAFEEGSDTALFSFPVVVGKKGMAWGRGGQSDCRLTDPQKNEGDAKSPAGLFSLTSLFGSVPISGVKMPFLLVTKRHFCVDDPASRSYNVIVDETEVVKDWKSAEEMLRKDSLYEKGVVINHNVDPITPGMGSCIFMHCWRNASCGTAGCTAMSPENLDRLIHWLDRSLDPYLVQTPKEGYPLFLSSLRIDTMRASVTKRLGPLINA